MHNHNIKQVNTCIHMFYYKLPFFIHFKGTPLRSGCDLRKEFSPENLYFFVTNVFSVSKLIVWYLNMSCIYLATRHKIGMYLLYREKRCNAFLISTDILVLVTDKRHIKLPQNRLLCPTHVDNKKIFF